MWACKDEEGEEMKLPETVKVGGHQYSVKFPYCFKERTDFNGQCDFDLSEIRVSEVDGLGNTRTGSTILVTFIHELLHAVDNVYSYQLFDEDTKKRETKIEMLAQGITQVLIDNRYFVEQEGE